MKLNVSASECGLICNALERQDLADSEEIKTIYGMICDEVWLYFKNEIFKGDIVKADEHYSMWCKEYGLFDARYI